MSKGATLFTNAGSANDQGWRQYDAFRLTLGVVISKKQLQEIAEEKMPDLNANTIEGAMNIIEGTARNMGITVE